MAYNPGVSDISGQIRAGYITQAGQNTAGTIGGILNQWGQNEQERRQTSASVAGELASNPFLQQQVQAKPEIAALLDKVSSGNANLAQTRQLAGWVQGAKLGQAQSIAAQQQAQALAAAQQQQSQGAQLFPGALAGQQQALAGGAQQQQLTALQLQQAQAQQAYLNSLLNNGQGAVSGKRTGILPAPVSGNPQFPGSAPGAPWQGLPAAPPQGTASGIPAGLPAFLDPAAGRPAQSPAPAPSPADDDESVAPAASAQPPPTPPEKAAFLQNFYRNYVQATHTAPPPEAMQKAADQWNEIERPIGVVQGGVQTDKDGNVTAQNWNRVYRKNSGAVRVDTAAIAQPFGSRVPGTLLSSQTFQPLTATNVGEDHSTPGQTSTVTGAPPVLMTPERQQAIKDATEHLNLLTVNQAKINQLGQAVDAYIKNNPSGARTNPFMGTPAGLVARQVLAGDTSGPMLNQGISNNLQQIMDNMREGSKSGSLGMRLTGNEWTQLKEAFPKTTDAPDVAMQGFQNVAKSNAYAKQYTELYLKNLRTMTPGDAAEAANKAMPDISTILPASKNAATSAAKAPLVKGMTGTASGGVKVIYDGSKWVPLNP